VIDAVLMSLVPVVTQEGQCYHVSEGVYSCETMGGWTVCMHLLLYMLLWRRQTLMPDCNFNAC